MGDEDVMKHCWVVVLSILPLRQPFAVCHCLGEGSDDLTPITSQSGVPDSIDIAVTRDDVMMGRIYVNSWNVKSIPTAAPTYFYLIINMNRSKD